MTLFAPRPLSDFLFQFRFPSAIQEGEREWRALMRWLRRIGRVG